MGGEASGERGGQGHGQGQGRDEWLTMGEAAARLGRSVETLRAQRRLGAFLAEKRDGARLTRPAWVEEYRLSHLGRKGWAARHARRADAAHQGDAPGRAAAPGYAADHDEGGTTGRAAP